MATCVAQYSPRQTSVNAPEAAGSLPRVSSPSESTAEVGNRPVALHTFPKITVDLASCRSTVGYALVEIVEGGYEGRSVNHLDVPGRPCQ